VNEGSAESGIRLEVLRTAEISIPQGYVFRSSGSRIRQLPSVFKRNAAALESPCLAFLVRHPHAGVLLVDTGLHRDASVDLRKDFGLPMSFVFRGLTPAAVPYDDKLRSLGVEPDEVGSVVMTHLHVDHTSGMRLLPNATFICARPEWDAAHSRSAVAKGYVRRHLPPKEWTQLLDYERDGEPYEAFARTIDLLGDGSVRLISTPGHTPGHQSVLIQSDDGRPILLVGDAAYTVRSIDDEVLPLLTADDETSRQSLRELRAFAQQTPEAALVPSHDPDAYQRCALHWS
jgi:glyoxylase-like metal-dependent hydrolase (beta-lactamase superfamily II)